MTSVNVREAKTHRSRLIPVRARAARTLGRDRGKVDIADDFDAPLHDEVLRAVSTV